MMYVREQTYQYHFISTLPIASVVEIEPVHVRIVLFGFRDILTVSYYEGARKKKNRCMWPSPWFDARLSL